MRYVILTNPAAGHMTIDQKLRALSGAAEILDAGIHGLDTASTEELAECARDLAARYDMLVIAGGDGTFSDIINAVDTRHTPVAYLPMGSGNALQHALKYKGTLAKIARQIKSGQFHNYDLINCANKARGFLVSIGIEGTVIRLLNEDTSIKHKSFGRYLQKVWKAYAGEYKRLSATVTCDGKTFQLKNLLSLMVMKQPYYGYGLKLVPQARFDDRRLHILWNTSGLLNSILTIICSFTIGNRIGHYHTCRQATVNLNAPHFIQIDGNQGWRADEFTFRVLSRALRIKF